MKYRFTRALMAGDLHIVFTRSEDTEERNYKVEAASLNRLLLRHIPAATYDELSKIIHEEMRSQNENSMLVSQRF